LTIAADGFDSVTPSPSGPVEVTGLLDRVPEGWTLVAYAGRRYGLSRRTRADGRAVSVYGEELGGPGVVSANVYRLGAGQVLRPCEMPAQVVVDFLRGWVPADDR
jgi:hypothetical protein